MTTINIRNVDEAIARKFKAEAALRGLTLAQMLKWLLVHSAETPVAARQGECRDGNHWFALGSPTCYCGERTHDVPSAETPEGK